MSLQGLDKVLEAHSAPERLVYESGSPGYSAELLDSIMDIYHELWRLGILWNNSAIEETFSRTTGRIRTLAVAEDPQVFNPQALLDATVYQLSETPYPAGRNDNGFLCGRLLSSIVQALYDLGHNGLCLDLSLLKEPPMTVATALKGSQGERLMLRCLGDVGSYGISVEHCDLELVGSTGCLGGHSIGGTFQATGKVKDAGNTSQGCTYHIDSLYAVSVTSLGACRFYIHDEGWNIYSGPREWLKGTARFRKKVKELKKNRFFEPELFEWKEPEPGNSIYVPDGKGEWKEVMP